MAIYLNNVYLLWKRKRGLLDTRHRLHRQFHKALIEALLSIPDVPTRTIGIPTQSVDNGEHRWSNWGKQNCCVGCREHKDEDT